MYPNRKDNISIIRVTPESLISALGLPEDASIRDIRMPFETDLIEIKFSSKLCHNRVEGGVILYITPETLKRHKEILEG